MSRFGRRGSFWVSTLVLALCLWSSGAPSVLYPTYAQEWGWVISLDRRSDEVIMLMHNVIPKSEATHEMSEGPYVAMEAHWRKP